jgi:hypothetical protein
MLAMDAAPGQHAVSVVLLVGHDLRPARRHRTGRGPRRSQVADETGRNRKSYGCELPSHDPEVDWF